MKKIWVISIAFIGFLILSSVVTANQEIKEELLTRVKAILKEVPLIDGHNDLPSSILEVARGDIDAVDISEIQVELPADLPRLREGRVSGQFWSAFIHTSYMETGDSLRQALREIDVIHRLVERYPDLELARTADDIKNAHEAGTIASLIGVEGGHAIEGSLAVLRMLYALGARYMTLTHMRTHSWADAATDFARHDGLTEFGEEVVREMNRIGMLVDLSHVSADTMKDVLRVSRSPVIYSHSNARAINVHPRNIPDDVLKLVAQNGGVVMVNFIPGYVVPTPLELRQNVGPEIGRSPHEPIWTAKRDAFLEGLRSELNDELEIARQLRAWVTQHPAPRGTVSHVADHIDHIRRVAGIDSVGIGSDYYDPGGPSMVEGLDNVTKFPELFAELLHRGYSEEDLKKIASGNLLRAMRVMEETAVRLSDIEQPALSDLKLIGAR